MIPRWPVHDPAESCQKVLEKIPVTFQGYFFKIVSMSKLHYLETKRIHAERVPKAQNFVRAPRGIRSRGTTFEFEYLRSFDYEFNKKIRLRMRSPYGVVS